MYSLKEALSHEPFLASLGYGFVIALLVCIIALALAVALLYALFLVRVYAKKELKLWLLLMQIPLVIPYALSSVLIFLLYFPGGPLGSLGSWMIGGSLGIITAYMYKVTPFLLLVCYPGLLQIKNEELYFHRLHSNSWHNFFGSIFLRRVLKPLFVGLFVVFAYALSAYEIPSVLGSVTSKMPALIIYETMNELGSYTLDMAYWMSGIVLLLIMLSSVCFVGGYKLANRGLK